MLIELTTKDGIRQFPLDQIQEIKPNLESTWAKATIRAFWLIYEVEECPQEI